MTFHAILKVSDTFPFMATFYIGRGVFMAVIAGEFGEVVVNMAGYTTRIVVAVQFKQFVVIKTQCPPCTGLMTLHAS